MKNCKPFKTATKRSISQGYHAEHRANDFVSFFGDILVAPFNCKVIKIIGLENAADMAKDLLREGCGIRMQSIENPDITAVYWHCQNVFPVSVGDTVLQGQPVAMMGNTGFVMAGGVVVPYDIRLIPPYPGTHLHYSMERKDGDGGLPLDPSDFIDYTIPVSFNLITTIRNILNKMVSVLK